MQAEIIKKKIMFSKGDDFYYLSYNILLILHGLECYCGKRIFRDYRKLAFLVDFISDRSLAETINSRKTKLNPNDREQFVRAYGNGLLRMNEIIKLLFTLEKKGIVSLNKEIGKDTIDVCLNKENITIGFFDHDLFSFELNNLSILKDNIPKSNILTLDTLLTRLFNKYGIITWAN
jgi:hypothetical protein